MKQFNPFPNLHTPYGAPMGRREDNPARLKGLPAYRLHARHQGGGSGYDKGGAYWGTPSNVWGVWAWVDGEAVVVYTRACTRAQAINQVINGA